MTTLECVNDECASCGLAIANPMEYPAEGAVCGVCGGPLATADAEGGTTDTEGVPSP